MALLLAFVLAIHLLYSFFSFNKIEMIPKRTSSSLKLHPINLGLVSTRAYYVFNFLLVSNSCQKIVYVLNFFIDSYICQQMINVSSFHGLVCIIASHLSFILKFSTASRSTHQMGQIKISVTKTQMNDTVQQISCCRCSSKHSHK